MQHSPAFRRCFFSKLIWTKQNSMLRMNHTSSMPVLRPEPNGCGDKTCKYEWKKALIVFGFLPLDVLMCQNKSQKPLCRSLVSPDTLSALWWSQPALPCQWSAVSPPATSFQSGRATAWGMEHLSGCWNGTTLARFCWRVESKCEFRCGDTVLIFLVTPWYKENRKHMPTYVCIHLLNWHAWTQPSHSRNKIAVEDHGNSVQDPIIFNLIQFGLKCVVLHSLFPSLPLKSWNLIFAITSGSCVHTKNALAPLVRADLLTDLFIHSFICPS